MTTTTIDHIAAADLPERGQPLANGVFVGRYWVNDQERALILLPDEFEGAWGEYGKKIEGADSYSDGAANTQAMADAGSEIAQKAMQLGGHIPSCLEAAVLMAAKSEGLVELRGTWHWLSSQFSADNAYLMDFGNGNQTSLGKNYEFFVRPVRSLPIH